MISKYSVFRIACGAFFSCVALTFVVADDSARQAVPPTQLVADVLKSWPQGGGLAVVVGATDPAVLTALTHEGRILVHGLCLDAATRDSLRTSTIYAGLYGLCSVSTWQGRPRLPYADRLVNILVADLDALGASAPPRKELERVVAPEGLLYLRSKGEWTATRTARPAALDHWGHFDHGADGNPLSQDTVSGPARQQQWVTNIMPIPAEGNPAGYDPGAGLRVAGRYAILDLNDSAAVGDAKKKGGNWVLQVRDAWNGTPLWTLPRDSEVARKRWSLIADENAIYTYLSVGAEVAAIDLARGKTLRSYPGTAPKRADGKPGPAVTEGETANLRATAEHLVATVNGEIRCFDKATAKQRWSFERAGIMALGTVVDEPTGRVYALLAERQPQKNFQGRWPVNRQVKELIALNLADGKTVWECPGIASTDVKAPSGKIERRAPGQIIPCGKYVAVFGGAAIGAGNMPLIASVDRETGRLLHLDDAPFKREYNVSAYDMLVRDGSVYFAGAFTNLWRYDPATGVTDRVLNYTWNQRCTRMTATPNWLLFGQSAWLDKELAGEQASVARSGCAIGNVPANGMTYYTPNACGCIAMIRGFHALTGASLDAPVEDNQRLESGGKPSAPISYPAEKLPAGPIAAEWTKAPGLTETKTKPVTSGDLRIVAVVHQHRVEAYRGDRLIWTAVADARISGPPIVSGETVCFGSHDGYVYGVALADGSPRFRTLIAPAHRQVMVDAQLESAWPVYGLAVMDGKIIASAGTHPGLGGGVAVVALDPRTGVAAWRKMLTQNPNEIPAGGGRSVVIADRSFINGIPQVADGKITLGDGTRLGRLFTFAPDENEKSMEQRLTIPQPKKK